MKPQRKEALKNNFRQPLYLCERSVIVEANKKTQRCLIFTETTAMSDSTPATLPSRLLSSPLLLVVLLVAASIFAVSWYQTESVRRAPNIPGYDWAKHPNTLLIAAPLGDHCLSCGLSISDLALKD